jgi:hypothetical protein
VTVTATHDRPSDLDEEPAEPAWDERPIVGTRRGLPWWGAVLLAFGLAAIAAWIDIQRQDSLGRIYQAAYVLGCLGAVALVRRRNLFGPMVQPPLVFAVTAIGAVVLNQPGSPFSAGLKQLLLSVALPLTSNFPTMAITTGAAVAIGLFRLWLQRDPNPRIRSNRAGREPVGALDARPGRVDPASRRPRDRPPVDGPGYDRPHGGPPRPRRDASQRSGRDADRVDRDPPRTGRGQPPSAERPMRGDRRPLDPDRRRRQPGPDQPRRTDQPGPDQPRRPRRRPPDDYR